ncbi:MAG: PorP/SprF family type IX secretion system membrane protein [Candidatus Cyclobacteriaceae bacterium M3_2C_046]
MKKLRFLIVAILISFCSATGFSQSNGLISHYMFNPLVINPAFAGFENRLSAGFIIKKQWSDVEGAPFSQIFSVHSPLKDKISAGLTLVNDQMGGLNQQGAYAAYAYRINFPRGSLALGLQGGFTAYRYNFEDILLKNPRDPIFSQENLRAFVPNFGTGFLYETSRYYLGFSIPQLFKFAPDQQLSYALQKQHIIINGGYQLPLSQTFQLYPSFLSYFRKDHPPEINLNLNILIAETIWAGVIYRNLHTLTFLTKLLLKPNLEISYAYDSHTGQVRSLAHNSHEIMLAYHFNLLKKEVTSFNFF